MFEKGRSLLLRSSASALSHNLDSHEGKQRIAVIHKSSVNIVFSDPNDGKQTSYQLDCKNSCGTKSLIVQVKWCVINKTLVLVVLSEDGLRIYDETGADMHFWYHIDANDTTCQCLCILPENRVAVGICSGNILIFQLGPRCSDCLLTDTIRTVHNGLITALASTSRHITSGGEDGQFNVWNLISPYQHQHSFESYGFPCTAIGLWSDKALVAYGSGHLRLFDILAGHILAEVAAHAKWISAMDCSKSSFMALTVSEDSFLRVWQINSLQEDAIIQKFSECIPDTQLCGACFLNPMGTKFAVTGYESEEIVCYSV